MPQAFGGYHLLLVITCDQTNFMIAVTLRDRTAQTVVEAFIYRVIYLFGPPRQIISDEATEFSSSIIQAILCILNCRLKVISPYNHGSSKCERQIRMISKIIMKHLWDKGQMWPLFATTTAYAMNTFASEALTLPLLAGVAALKSLITLYINICKITFFPSTQFAYIYVSIFICMLCYKDQLGDFTYIYV